MTAYSLSQIFGSVARIGVILSLGSMLVTGFLHGDMMAFAGAGLQYWVMQPVFWNILQVGWAAGGQGNGPAGIVRMGYTASTMVHGRCQLPPSCWVPQPCHLGPSTLAVPCR